MSDYTRYLNHCQKIYQRALRRRYGTEVEQFSQQAAGSLVDSLYGAPFTAAALLKQTEELLQAVSRLHWRRGYGWVQGSDGTHAIPLDSKNTLFFKQMFEPQVSLWVAQPPQLRNLLDGKLMYRLDAYTKLLDWEQRYASNLFPRPNLPDYVSRQLVQGATILDARSELDLMYFSRFGQFGQLLRNPTVVDDGSPGHSKYAVDDMLKTAESFTAITDWLLDFIDAFKAVEAGQRAGTTGIL